MARSFQELMALLDTSLAEVTSAQAEVADTEAKYKGARLRLEKAVHETRVLQAEFRTKIDDVIGEPTTDRVRQG